MTRQCNRLFSDFNKLFVFTENICTSGVWTNLNEENKLVRLKKLFNVFSEKFLHIPTFKGFSRLHNDVFSIL